MMKFKGHLPLIMCLLGLIVTTSCTLDTLHEPANRPSIKSEMPAEPLTQPPKQCLSLSGGGMRAASYGIGVMKALSEFERLDSLDIISGVSGGTYAMLWYYTGIHAMDTSLQTAVSAPLFSDANLEQFIHQHNGWSYLAKDTLTTQENTKRLIHPYSPIRKPSLDANDTAGGGTEKDVRKPAW